MSGPKHLWSGDWERESAESDRSHPEPSPVTQTTEQEELAQESAGRRVRMRTLAMITGAAIVLVVIGVVLADTLGGSSGHHKNRPSAAVTHPGTTTQPGGGSPLTQTAPQSTTPGSQTSPQGPRAIPPARPRTTPGTPGPQGFPGTTVPAGPATVPSTPHVDWLGMQIITSPKGAVVNTIRTGSTADAAGFEPGDVISNVAGSAIAHAQDIKDATAKVQSGAQVAIELTRGSTLIRVAVKMSARPTISP